MDFGDQNHRKLERKYKDADGVVFDISKHGWVGTDSYVAKQSDAQTEKTLAAAK